MKTWSASIAAATLALGCVAEPLDTEEEQTEAAEQALDEPTWASHTLYPLASNPHLTLAGMHLMSHANDPPGDIFAARERAAEVCTYYSGGFHFADRLKMDCTSHDFASCVSLCQPIPTMPVYIPPPTGSWEVSKLFPFHSNPYLVKRASAKGQVDKHFVHPMSYATPPATTGHRHRVGESCTRYKSAAEPHAGGLLILDCPSSDFNQCRTVCQTSP
jgi:hypothetical protein